MQNRLASAMQTRSSSLATNRVLRNTYLLLAMTLGFSALTAYLAMTMNAAIPSPWVTLIGFYGLLFLTNATANSALGLVSVFALTGFMGYTLGPILNVYLGNGLGNVVMLAFGATAAVFSGCSFYVLSTKRDMSFLGGMMMALFVVLLLGMLASAFFNISGLHLALSALFVIFSSGAILMETSHIIHGGETNYIRATVSLYVSLYNLFVSFLSLFSSRD